jgi:hypothetical protein
MLQLLLSKTLPHLLFLLLLILVPLLLLLLLLPILLLLPPLRLLSTAAPTLKMWHHSCHCRRLTWKIICGREIRVFIRDRLVFPIQLHRNVSMLQLLVMLLIHGAHIALFTMVLLLSMRIRYI